MSAHGSAYTLDSRRNGALPLPVGLCETVTSFAQLGDLLLANGSVGDIRSTNAPTLARRAICPVRDRPGRSMNSDSPRRVRSTRRRFQPRRISGEEIEECRRTAGGWRGRASICHRQVSVCCPMNTHAAIEYRKPVQADASTFSRMYALLRGEAAVVCLDGQEHPRKCHLQVEGHFTETFRVSSSAVTPAMKASHHDAFKAVEHSAAEGVAFLLMLRLTPYRVVQQSKRGQADDRWLALAASCSKMPQGLSALAFSPETTRKRRGATKREGCSPNESEANSSHVRLRNELQARPCKGGAVVRKATALHQQAMVMADRADQARER